MALEDDCPVQNRQCLDLMAASIGKYVDVQDFQDRIARVKIPRSSKIPSGKLT